MKSNIYFQLKPIERQLRSALDSNYARLSAREFENFCDTYKAHYDKPLTNNEKNCNTCRLKALKRIAEDYFEYQSWYERRWGAKPEDFKGKTEQTPDTPEIVTPAEETPAEQKPEITETNNEDNGQA